VSPCSKCWILAFQEDGLVKMINIQIKILLRYRTVLVVPLIIAGAIVFIRYYFLPPTVKVQTVIPFFVFFFLFMEDVFSNLFEPQSKELYNYQQFPLKISQLIYDKNIAVISLTLLYATMLSVIGILIFHLSIQSFINSLTYYLIVTFPFIAFGNIISTFSTKYSSLAFVFVRLFVSIIIVAILSLPYLIIKISMHNIIFCYPYILVIAFLWRYVSIPIAAKQYLRNTFKLLETI
jgi:hypothetical protein